MVTTQNGLQFSVFIFLLWSSLSTQRGVLALRRSQNFEIPENLETLSDDLTSGIDLDLLTSLEDPNRGESSQRRENALESSIQSENKDQNSDPRWLSPPPPTDEALQNLLSHQNNRANNLYGIYLNELGSKKFRGFLPFQIQSDTAFRSLPPLRSLLPLRSLPQKRGNHFVYSPSSSFKGNKLTKRLNGDLPPVKRWWGGASYYNRPRPQIDRRAGQSKHYGCLKRCISIGKLHPIQCHTLC